MRGNSRAFGGSSQSGFGVEQTKYALGARHRGHRLAELLADGLDRTEKHVRQEEELNERANVHVNRGLNTR